MMFFKYAAAYKLTDWLSDERTDFVSLIYNVICFFGDIEQQQHKIPANPYHVAMQCNATSTTVV